MSLVYTIEQIQILESASSILGLSLSDLLRRCTAPDSHTLTPDTSSPSFVADQSPAESFDTDHIISSPPLPHHHYSEGSLNHVNHGQSALSGNGMLPWTIDEVSNAYFDYYQSNSVPMATLSESMQVSSDPLSAAISPTSFESAASTGLWEQAGIPLQSTEAYMNTPQVNMSNADATVDTGTSLATASSDERNSRKRRSPGCDLAESSKRRCTDGQAEADQCGFLVASTADRRSVQVAGSGKRACVRCKMQRIECPVDFSDPSGPCLRCKKLAAGKRCQVQLPCLRYKISDSILYRPGSSLRLYADFPFEGPNAGRLQFAIPVPNSDCWIEISQGGRPSIKLRMRQFSVPTEQLVQIKEHKRPLYQHPFELADRGEVAQATIRHTREQLESYINAGMRENDPISSEVFHAALRAANIKSKTLIRDTLGLWAACRLSEGDWRISGCETLGLPLNSNGIFALTPLMNAQLHASDIVDVIGPFADHVLRRLEQHILKKGDIFESFLCIYVLMHNYELMVARQRKVAIRRKCQYRFTNMLFIRNIQAGAKTMLAYFHYICGGYRPFALDWDALPTSGPFGSLSVEQKALMKKIKSFAINQSDHIEAVTHSHLYEEPFYFVGQLFDHAWKPRDTYQWDFDLTAPWTAADFII